MIDRTERKVKKSREDKVKDIIKTAGEAAKTVSGIVAAIVGIVGLVAILKDSGDE